MSIQVLNGKVHDSPVPIASREELKVAIKDFKDDIIKVLTHTDWYQCGEHQYMDCIYQDAAGNYYSVIFSRSGNWSKGFTYYPPNIAWVRPVKTTKGKQKFVVVTDTEWK